MNKIYPTLYSRTNTGATQQWHCVQEGNSYYTVYGQVGGKLVQTLPQFAETKNPGKKNETTPVDQATKEIEALYKKQRKSNYFDNINDIDSGFLEPQLAKPCKNYIDKVDWSKGVIVDEKLNGFACIGIGKGAFTRTNEQYHSIPHILEELGEVFSKYPNAYLHGELFNPDYVNHLNRIAELIAVTRKPKDIDSALLEESKKIVQYHLYDGYGFLGIERQTPAKERRQALLELFKTFGFNSIHPIRYKVCYSFDEMNRFAIPYIQGGGEGVILRNPEAEYQHKRTKDLLKFKKMEDAEFKTIRFEEGTGNWKGCAKAVWCELPNGTRDKEFKCNIEGTQEFLREVWNNPLSYLGKWITVRYQELSEYNVPLIPYTDLVIRKEIEG